MARIFLLFSHNVLSDAQWADAQTHWGVTETVNLPDDLQALFSNVPPQLPTVTAFAQPILQWLEEQVGADDIVLAQGEFGLTYCIVEWCKAHHIKVVYATTQRISRIDESTGETIRTFEHVRFRSYF